MQWSTSSLHRRGLASPLMMASSLSCPPSIPLSPSIADLAHTHTIPCPPRLPSGLALLLCVGYLLAWACTSVTRYNHVTKVREEVSIHRET